MSDSLFGSTCPITVFARRCVARCSQIINIRSSLGKLPVPNTVLSRSNLNVSTFQENSLLSGDSSSEAVVLVRSYASLLFFLFLFQFSPAIVARGLVRFSRMQQKKSPSSFSPLNKGIKPRVPTRHFTALHQLLSPMRE